MLNAHRPHLFQIIMSSTRILIVEPRHSVVPFLQGIDFEIYNSFFSWHGLRNIDSKRHISSAGYSFYIFYRMLAIGLT